MVVLVLAIVGVLGAIALVAANADAGSDAPAAPAGASTPPEEPEPAAPENLRGRATSFKVTLTWQPGVGGGEVERWIVERDGETVGIVQTSRTRFVDEDALPGSTYVYEVAALDSMGIATTADRARVKTPSAPPATAQVKGVYDIRLRVQSSYGITGIDGLTAAWRVTPSCDEGPCDISIKVLQVGLPAIEAALRQGRYEAAGSGRFGFTCGDVPQTSSYDLGVRVSAADAVGKAWRATRVEGTLVLSMPEQLGCRSGGVTYSVSGRLVEGA